MVNTPAAEVDLWLSTEPAQLDMPTAKCYEAMLNDAERLRWQRFLHQADRDRFLHARALTRSVLARYLGDLEPAQVPFSQGSWGKPTLAPPARDHGLFFNLSHTHGMAVLAVTRVGEVGVDVECIDRRVELLALAERYFAATEYHQIAQLSGQAQRERFFAVWTLKEAYLKARGLGLHFGMNSFAFDCSTLAIRLEESAPARSGGAWLFRLIERGQFRIALALQQTAVAYNQSVKVLDVQVCQGQPGDTFHAI